MLLSLILISQTISTLTGGDYIKAIHSGNYVFEVSQRGVSVINIENPADPKAEFEIPTLGISLDLVVSGDNLYILDSQEGIIIYSLKEREKKNTVKVRNAICFISIPPYIYLGTNDGFIFIYEIDGYNLKSKGKIELKLPVTKLQIAPQGLQALISDSIVAQIRFMKGGDIEISNKFYFPSRITKFFTLDTLILFGKREGGLFLGKFSQPYIEVLKEIIPADVITGLEVYGSQIFAGTEDGKLFFISYPDFTSIGRAQLVGQINDFIALGNILLVSVGRAGISVLTLPELEEIKTLGGFGSLVSVGVMKSEILYLLDPLLGLRFISFFSPFNPQKEEETKLSGSFVKIITFKNKILALIREGGFWILSSDNISQIKGFFPLEGNVNDMSIVGERVFVATDRGIVGIEDKNGELEKSFEIETEGKVFKLLQIGDKFLSLQENGIFIYDKEGKIVEHRGNIFPILYSLRGNEVFVCDIKGKIFRFSGGLSGFTFLFSAMPPVGDFGVGKNEIYVVDGSTKLRVYSLPKGSLRFEIELPEPIFSLKIKYPYLFLYGKSDRVFIYFIGRDMPEFVSSIRTRGYIKSLDFSEAGIFIGEDGFIESYRFYRFETPTEISYFLTSGELYRALPIPEDNILYIAGGSAGIMGIDVTNIYSPELFFQHTPAAGATYDILILQRFLITANLEGGIEVFELVSSRTPKFFTKITGDVLAIDVLRNSFLISGERTGLIKIYDTRGGIFSHISGLSEFNVPVLDIDTYKDYAYVSLGDEGFAILDLTVPHFPRVKGKYDPDFPVYRIKVIDNKLFAICGPYGVIEYNLKENGDVLYIKHIDTPGNAQDVNKMGDYYLISDTYGLEIYKGG